MQWEIEPDLRQLMVVAELARSVTKSGPANLESWLMLGRALIQVGDLREATVSFREAAVIFPQSHEIKLELAVALQRQDLFEEAFSHAEGALAIAPEDPWARLLYFELADALKLKEKIDKDAAAVLPQDNFRVMNISAKALGPAGTITLCDSQLARNPAHTNARYLKAIALTALGRTDEAKHLIPLDRLIEIQQLAAPPGYADELFRQTLAAEIRANPTFMADPRNKATRGGWQTLSLRQPDAVAVGALMMQIRCAVDEWESRLLAAEDEFVQARPEKARLRAWAVICGAEGRQRAHLHPEGWISGVYYVAAPRPDAESAWRGPLIAGAIDPDSHDFDPPWGTRRIEPVPGRLVMFPSFVPHATEASGIEGARISVAFDVIPLAQDPNS